MAHDKQQIKPQPQVNTMRIFDELSRMPLAEPSDTQRFVQAVREKVRQKSLKPAMRDKLLRECWTKVPDDEKSICVSCWLQGDRPTVPEAKSVIRFAFDLVVDEPTALSTIILPQVSHWWSSLPHGADANEDQKRKYSSYCKGIIDEFQRFLERIVKLKDTMPPTSDGVAATPDTIRFAVDRITDALITRVSGVEAKKAKAKKKAGTRGDAPDERDQYLAASGYLLRPAIECNTDILTASDAPPIIDVQCCSGSQFLQYLQVHAVVRYSTVQVH